MSTQMWARLLWAEGRLWPDISDGHAFEALYSFTASSKLQKWRKSPTIQINSKDLPFIKIEFGGVWSRRNMGKSPTLELKPLKCHIQRRMPFSFVWQWQKRSDFMTRASNRDVAYELDDESGALSCCRADGWAEMCMSARCGLGLRLNPCPWQISTQPDSWTRDLKKDDGMAATVWVHVKMELLASLPPSKDEKKLDNMTVKWWLGYLGE